MGHDYTLSIIKKNEVAASLRPWPRKKWCFIIGNFNKGHYESITYSLSSFLFIYLYYYFKRHCTILQRVSPTDMQVIKLHGYFKPNNLYRVQSCIKASMVLSIIAAPTLQHTDMGGTVTNFNKESPGGGSVQQFRQNGSWKRWTKT
jgi:hypothetical protein